MKIQWTRKNICKAVYIAVFVLMFAIALLLFRQEGLFINVEYQEKFYRQTEVNESGRTFQRDDLLFSQEYYYPQSDVVYIRVSGDNVKAKSWRLDFDGDKVTIDDGAKKFTGDFHINEWDATFFYDGEDNFEFQFGTFDSEEKSEKDISTDRFLINDFLCMANGQTDHRNKNSLMPFLGWILIQALVYPLLFHQDSLFELRKAFEWDYKNADALEPSGFYYFGNYVAAAVCWGTSLILYLAALAIV